MSNTEVLKIALSRFNEMVEDNEIDITHTVDGVSGLDLREALTAAISMMEGWVSVEVEQPENGDTVLVWIDHGDSQRFDIYVWDKWAEKNQVTHWRPLPLPPEADQ